MEANGLGTVDTAMAKAIAKRLLNALGQHRRRGTIIEIGKAKSARLWRLS
jgi:hypothetical protein